jgi:hypothetical protein
MAALQRTRLKDGSMIELMDNDTPRRQFSSV